MDCVNNVHDLTTTDPYVAYSLTVQVFVYAMEVHVAIPVHHVSIMFLS